MTLFLMFNWHTNTLEDRLSTKMICEHQQGLVQCSKTKYFKLIQYDWVCMYCTALILKKTWVSQIEQTGKHSRVTSLAPVEAKQIKRNRKPNLSAIHWNTFRYLLYNGNGNISSVVCSGDEGNFFVHWNPLVQYVLFRSTNPHLQWLLVWNPDNPIHLLTLLQCPQCLLWTKYSGNSLFDLGGYSDGHWNLHLVFCFNQLWRHLFVATLPFGCWTRPARKHWKREKCGGQIWLDSTDQKVPRLTSPTVS